jgi:hypothetical protein
MTVCVCVWSCQESTSVSIWNNFYPCEDNCYIIWHCHKNLRNENKFSSLEYGPQLIWPISLFLSCKLSYQIKRGLLNEPSVRHYVCTGSLTIKRHWFHTYMLDTFWHHTLTTTNSSLYSFSGRKVSRGLWPPHLPDFNLCDFHWWGMYMTGILTLKKIWDGRSIQDVTI